MSISNLPTPNMTMMVHYKYLPILIKIASQVGSHDLQTDTQKTDKKYKLLVSSHHDIVT